MKRMLAIAISGIMAMSMVACGQQAETASQVETQPEAEQQEAQTEESQPQEEVGLANP
jgi:hypothetical protein